MHLYRSAAPYLALLGTCLLANEAAAFKNCTFPAADHLVNLNVSVNKTCPENTNVTGFFRGDLAPRQVRAQLVTGAGGRAITLGTDNNGTPVAGTTCRAIDTSPGGGGPGQVISPAGVCENIPNKTMTKAFWDLQRPDNP